MKQEVKEAADELVADLRHTLAWAARAYGMEEREEVRRMLAEVLGDSLDGQRQAEGRE